MGAEERSRRIRRAQQTAETRPAAAKYRLKFAEGVESGLPMIVADAARSNASEWKILCGDEQKRVVDAHAAGHSALQHAVDQLLILRKQVQRKRAGPPVHILKIGRASCR